MAAPNKEVAKTVDDNAWLNISRKLFLNNTEQLDIS